MSDPSLLLGRRLDDDGTTTEDRVDLGAADLTTHGVIVGMTGSGKTGLGVCLIEEALTAGVPVLAIDPKGDLTNLLLTFPELRPEDFAPWVPEGADAAEVATTWRDGLAGWDLGPEQIARLRSTARFGVYTPGSTAATPLNLVGSLTAPGARDDEDLAAEVSVVTAGLLGMVGVSGDPLASPPHLLVANLLHDAWLKGESLDLAGLIARVQSPPMRTLGVMELDAVIPPKERDALAVRLNGALATPGFAPWMQGAPLDVPQLLWAPDGRPSLACVCVSHLSDDERQMAVSRILAALIRWFRGQPGTDQLRALVYIDEVMGYVPPTAAPPTKAPILTIMKQARAFGVGMVLATQNPVDVDYKAMSNAGTWMIGRLQTERDKARLLEGMNTAAGGVDLGALDATITGLGPRQFLLHQTKGKPAVRFASRWAMSYLRGPVTGAQMAELPGREELGAAPPAAPAPESALASAQADAPAPASPTAAPATATADAPQGLPVMPKVADGVPVRWLDPAAPWGDAVGLRAQSTTLTPMLALRVNLLYTEKAGELHHTEEWEAVVPALSDMTDVTTAIDVDHDDRDLRDQPPPGATYLSTTARIDTKTYFSTITKDLKEHLRANRTLTVPRNAAVGLWGRPGETAEQFAARCGEAARTLADQETEKIRAKLAARIDKLRRGVATAQQRADRADRTAAEAQQGATLNTVGSVLGGLLGGRRSTSGLAGAARRAMSDRDRAGKAQDRAQAEAAKVLDKVDDLQALEDELSRAVVEIDERWSAAAADISEVHVALGRSDVNITMMALLWVPT